MKKLQYKFEEVRFCNMCGQKDSNNKMLGQRLNQSQGLRPKTKRGITTSVMKCTKCELIYSNPQPVPLDIKDHYGVIPEDYWREEYFVKDPNCFSEQISEIKKLLPFLNKDKKGGKALDIGAGIGKCMIALEKAGFEAYGLEPSPQFIDRAIDKMKINPKRIKLGMLEEVEYKKDYFDFINFGAVLEHLYDPSESIKKALNWLKPRGIIYIGVPSSNYLIAKIVNFYYKIIGTNYVNNISPMHKPFHLFEFSYKSFMEHSKEAGYEIALHSSCVWTNPIIPRMKIICAPLDWYMEKSNSSIGLSFYLRKNG